MSPFVAECCVRAYWPLVVRGHVFGTVRVPCPPPQVLILTAFNGDGPCPYARPHRP